MTKIVAITGGIGSGKTTISKYLKKNNFAVHEADTAVSQLYIKPNKLFLSFLKKNVSKEVVTRNKIDKQKISEIIFNDKKIKQKLENYIHKEVKKSRESFVKKNIKNKKNLIFVDIPLLFETGLDKEMDKTVCVFTSARNQIERLKKRNDNSDNYYKELISKQMPSEEKCKLSDFTIETTSHEKVEEKVLEILNMLRV